MERRIRTGIYEPITMFLELDPGVCAITPQCRVQGILLYRLAVQLRRLVEVMCYTPRHTQKCKPDRTKVSSCSDSVRRNKDKLGRTCERLVRLRLQPRGLCPGLIRDILQA